MHLFRRFVATPLLAPDDRGDGGSTADGADDQHDPGAQGADDTGSSTGDVEDGSDADGYDADGADGSDRQGEDDDDDSDDPEIHDSARPLEERFTKLVKKHTKIKRQNFKNRALVQLARDLNITPAALTDLVSKARNYEALQSGSAESKALLRQLLALDADDDAPQGRGKPATTKGKGRQADEDDDDFDESALPFDTSTENGKFFAAEAKRARKLEKAITSILDRLDQVQTGVTQRFEKQELTQTAGKWESAMNAAATKIQNKGLRTVFQDSIRNAWHRTKGKDPQGRPVDPGSIISHYLKLLGVNPTQAAMARGAAQQRIVAQNQNRPAHQGAGRGTAAPAEGQRPKTLADVHRKVRSRIPA